MNTRKMQMYQQWIYYSEYVQKQKALESRDSESELLPSAPYTLKKKEKKERKKQRQGEGEREKDGEGGVEKREGEEKSWALFRLFFFF